MLGLMRKHARSWIIKVALFAIVVVFIFWGGYSYTERKASRVAVVNGSSISIQEYQQAYQNLVEQMRRRLGEQYSSELAEALNLKEQALNRLINRRLLLAEAQRLNLQVTQKELQDAISSYPAFQTEGRFDPGRYRSILNQMRLTPEEFEASQRQDLLIGKVRRLIASGAKVLDKELLSFFHYTRDEINLAYAEVDPSKFTDQLEPTEEHLKGYFDQNQDSYRIPAKRRIAYVQFRPQDYLDEVKPSEEEIESYYLLHEDKYRESKKVRARHILFRIPEDATTSEKQAVLARAKKVLNKVRQGADFADLARQYSQDSTATRGGDLGYFGRSDMVKPFAEAAFSLEPGEISDLVRSRYGLHIIKVEDVRESSSKPLEEVKDSVIQEVKEEQAREIALKRAESFADEAFALGDLRKAAKLNGLEVKESGFFAAGKPIPGLGSNPDLNETLFSLHPDEVSPALAVGENQVVAQVVAVQDSHIPEFASVKARVKKDWLARESKILARKKAEEWLAAARRQGDLAGIAARNGLRIKETGFFTSYSPPSSLGGNRDLLVSAFALTPEHPVAPEVFEIKDRFVLLQLKNRKTASEDEFQRKKEELAEQLLRAKKEETFQRWLTALRQQSEIKILKEI